MKTLFIAVLMSVSAFAQGGRDNPFFRPIGKGASIPGSCSGNSAWIYTDGSYRYCLSGAFSNPFIGLHSLNGLMGATQTFTNDTNVTVVSGGTAHVITWAGALAVPRGGTGAATFTSHGILLGHGTGAFTALSPAADSIPLWQSSGADPTVTPINLCGDSAHALSYDTSTHAFGCQAITGSGGAVADPGANGIMKRTASNTTAPATGHDAAAILTCVAASASGTAYTCSTSPAFTPAAGDVVLFKADVANTGSATLNVNSSSAATVKKQGGGTNLAANDLLASQYADLLFDGTNWQMQGQTGNASSGGGSVQSGTFASLPSCTTSGALYVFADSYYTSAFCDGSNWIYTLNGTRVYPPSLTSYTWDQQGSATVSVTSGAAELASGDTGGNAMRSRMITAPSTPYTITIAFQPMLAGAGEAGLCIKKTASGEYISFDLYNAGGFFAAEHWSDFQTYGGSQDSLSPVYPFSSGQTIWISFTDNGTNHIRKLGFDPNNMVTVSTVSRTTYLSNGGDKIGICVNNNGQSVPSMAVFLSWRQT